MFVNILKRKAHTTNLRGTAMERGQEAVHSITPQET